MNYSTGLQLRFVAPVPDGWRNGGSPVACTWCHGKQFRFRRITTRVAEPLGASWQDLNGALDDAFGETTPQLNVDPAHDLVFTEREALVRTPIGNRCWLLRLKTAHWSGGRRDAWQKIVSGEGVVGELLLYREKPGRRRSSTRVPGSQALPALFCRMTLWLRRANSEEGTPDRLGIPEGQIELMDINHLRNAIRANRITFPAQIPTFPGAYRPDLQHKVTQLYFLMGWSFPKIADKYRLTRSQARRILNEWKQRAARAGYVQHIPMPEGVGHLAIKEEAVFEERRLIAGLHAGNEIAYTCVIDRFQNQVYNLAYRLVGNQGEAERVTEEAFLELFRSAGNTHVDLSLQTRLYQSVVRKSGAHSFGQLRTYSWTTALSPLETALKALHPAHRTILVLREVEDMSYEEVADVLNIPVSTVKSRVAEAREALITRMVGTDVRASKDTPNPAVTYMVSPIDHVRAES